ncbi:uncharacterized protein [Populus alba]|nr:ATP-citrate synthase beta chain protein 2-like [Populus alba]XP_034915516.1 ATP-citrate synthase beta chain protein 2-like [Populus alba]KAJ6973639.1 ATP-citrate synthase beta chain protein 2-like [Populus alba x Populus x berolinensis]
MSNELYNAIACVIDVIYEGIAVGGDMFPGSTLSDHVPWFNNIPQVKTMVVLGKLVGRDEYSLVEALKQGKVRNRALLACQCLPLLNRVMVWVMSSLFYGSRQPSTLLYPFYGALCSLCFLPAHDLVCILSLMLLLPSRHLLSLIDLRS